MYKNHLKADLSIYHDVSHMHQKAYSSSFYKWLNQGMKKFLLILQLFTFRFEEEMSEMTKT